MIEAEAIMFFGDWDQKPPETYPDFVEEPVSGQVLPLSPGGIVRVKNLRDAFILANQNVSSVFVERELSEEFYDATQDCDPNIPQIVFNFIQQLRDAQDLDQKKRDIREYVAGNPHPVLNQFVSDMDTVYPFMRELADHCKAQRELKLLPANQPVRHVGYTQKQRARGGLHYDVKHFVELINYTGPQADFLDRRVTMAELDMIESALERTLECPIDQLSNTTLETTGPFMQAGVGNITYTKGSEFLGRAIRRQNIIDEIGIHRTPVLKSHDIRCVSGRYL